MIIATASSVQGLGQTQTGVSRVLEDQYATLRAKCIQQYGEQFCNSVMPRNMVYAITRRTFPWWAWMIAGYMAAKVLR